MRILFFLLLCGLIHARVAAAQRPNILFIMTDDHASHALSCYGSKINQTPNLDRIAKDGMRFTNAFVTNSICTPSRATLLTGKYSHLNGVPVFNRFDGSQQTAPKLLQAAGYYTAMIGKWHLESDPVGFDHWVVLPGQGAYENPGFLTAQGPVKKQGYCTDIITDLAIECLDKRPADKPFLMYLHHKAPHRNWTPDAKNKALFADRHIPEPATLRDDYASRPAALPENEQTVAKDLTRNDLKLVPPDDLKGPERQKWLGTRPDSVEITLKDGSKKVLTGDELVAWKYQRYMQDYLACVQGVDDNIGRTLDYLAARGLLENTVIFYTSDNGFFLGDNGMYDKRFMYEPSLRVPLLVRWPGSAKPGAVTDLFALNVDFAPTMLDLAGQPVPADMQGRSLAPVLRGESPADWRKAMYYRYYHDPGDHNTRMHYGVRTETHKLIHYWKKDAWELFDLKNDPQELKNLAADPAHADLLQRMKTVLAEQKKLAKDDDQFADGVLPNSVNPAPKKAK